MLFDAQGELRRHGLQGARDRARSKHQRRCIDAAAAMQDRQGERATAYASLIGSALPRRAMAGSEVVTHSAAAALTCTVCATRHAALPFGSVARLILIQLQTSAIETGSRTLPFAASLNAWGKIMGASNGGQNYVNFARQSHLIGMARLRVASALDPGSAPAEFALVESLDFRTEGSKTPQAVLGTDFRTYGYPATVTISSGLFAHTRQHACAVDADALRLIHTSSWSIDFYGWLARLLPSLSQPQLWTWPMLGTEFGSHYKAPLRVKAHLLDAAALVMAVYANARLSVCDDGMVLNPSPRPLG